MQLAIQQTMTELLTLVPQAFRVQNSPVTRIAKKCTSHFKKRKKSSFHPKGNKREQEMVYSEAILTDLCPREAQI